MSKLDLEIDSLNLRCDNLQRMITDLANRLGLSELANEMTRFHNESVLDLEKERAALQEVTDECRHGSTGVITAEGETGTSGG